MKSRNTSAEKADPDQSVQKECVSPALTARGVCTIGHPCSKSQTGHTRSVSSILGVTESDGPAQPAIFVKFCRSPSLYLLTPHLHAMYQCTRNLFCSTIYTNKMSLRLQNFVCPPLAFKTASTTSSILLIYLSTSSTFSSAQTSLTSFINPSVVDE